VAEQAARTSIVPILRRKTATIAASDNTSAHGLIPDSAPDSGLLSRSRSTNGAPSPPLFGGECRRAPHVDQGRRGGGAEPSVKRLC
jgi:hypothetical protein